MKSSLSSVRSQHPDPAALRSFPVPPDPSQPQSVGDGADCTLTTAALAAALSLKEQSIRKRLSQTGSYFGVRPFRLPNRRLRWPSNAIEALLKGGAR